MRLAAAIAASVALHRLGDAYTALQSINMSISLNTHFEHVLSSSNILQVLVAIFCKDDR